jgi:hypothetical protein
MTCAVTAASEDDAVECANQKVIRFEEFTQRRAVAPDAHNDPAEGEIATLREVKRGLTASEIAHRFAMLAHLRRVAGRLA